MGWTDSLKKIPELVLRSVNLADDLKKVQQQVEKLQEQNLVSAQLNVKQEEQIRQLQEEARKNSGLFERILKLENELATLKALQDAHNKAHLQEIQIAKHELKDHTNERVKVVEGTLLLKFQTLEQEFKDALYEFTRSQTQPAQKFTPLQLPTVVLAPSDGGDGQGNS